jgi:hypothetical protein
VGQINNDLRMYRDALSAELKLSQWHQLPVFGQMIGHIGGTDDHGYPKSVPFGSVQSRTLKGTGKAIEVLTDFNHQGGWAIDVPVKLPLRKKPIYGDKQAKGNEEDFNWVYLRGLINQVRYPVKTSDGLMGEQALDAKKMMQIWKNTKDEIASINQRWQSYAPYDAIYRGYSDNLFDDPINMTQKSHPNFYVAGYGKVTWDSDNDTYEGNIATQIGNLSSTDVLDVQAIRNLQVYGSRHRIVPTEAGPYKVKGVLIINDAQMAQLASDPLFEKLHIALITADGDNAALFTGAYEAHLIEGVMVLVDINNPGLLVSGDTGYDATRGVVNYGNENPLDNPIHASDVKLAIYMGASAVLCGHTVPLQFKNRMDDYDNIKGEAGRTVVGYTRADRYDHDSFLAASEFVENSSSAVLATYSPNNPSWTSSSS